MSSPLRRSERSYSRSSPSRYTPNGFRRAQQNGYRASPQRDSVDSPSRLIEEFSKAYIDEERSFKRKLDEQADEQDRLHREALAKSLREHEEVRMSAERARERLELEMERVKRQQEEAEREALERARRAKAEEEAAAERRKVEEAKRQEQLMREAAARQRELEETQRRVEEQKRQQDAEKAKREQDRVEAETERKAKEQAEAQQKAQADARATNHVRFTPSVAGGSVGSSAGAPPATQPTTQLNGAASTSQPSVPLTLAQKRTAAPGFIATTGTLMPQWIVTQPEDVIAEHQRYLDLHSRLKTMRSKTLSDYEAQDRELKVKLGDMRRELNKTMGQLNKQDKKASAAAVSDPILLKHVQANISSSQHREFKRILLEAKTMNSVTVDISQFIVNVPATKVKQGVQKTQFPAALLFLLNHFAKMLINQLAQEVAADITMAEPIGIAAATVFAAPDFRFNGISLIDVLWAKYHKVCPVLFGMYGSENTHEGRAKVGWSPGMPEKDRDDRMKGFAAGFAAITLRDFSKSPNSNPAPNHLFWTSLARILNTPPDQRVSTQYVVVQNMLQISISRFVNFYGSAAIAALKKATGEFPESGPRVGGRISSRADLLKSLPGSWEKEFRFAL